MFRVHVVRPGLLGGPPDNTRVGHVVQTLTFDVVKAACEKRRVVSMTTIWPVHQRLNLPALIKPARSHSCDLQPGWSVFGATAGSQPAVLRRSRPPVCRCWCGTALSDRKVLGLVPGACSLLPAHVFSIFSLTVQNESKIRKPLKNLVKKHGCYILTLLVCFGSGGRRRTSRT